MGELVNEFFGFEVSSVVCEDFVYSHTDGTEPYAGSPKELTKRDSGFVVECLYVNQAAAIRLLLHVSSCNPGTESPAGSTTLRISFAVNFPSASKRGFYLYPQ